MGSLYMTAEGAAKTHLNNMISAKAAVLEGLLGECSTGGPRAWLGLK
jgi:hypothetical protein